LLQQELTGETLVERVLALARDDARRHRMAAAARSLARPNAASLVVDRIEQLARW
jgi:UDP-N-acetylglucosamine:LPS N-acetylglucosamine transferase